LQVIRLIGARQGGNFEQGRPEATASMREKPMTHDSDPVTYLRYPNDAVDAGEPQLVSSEGHDADKSSLSCEDDALNLKLFRVEQSAPRDLAEAFDRIFGKV
jgi:hypothetical protein